MTADTIPTATWTERCDRLSIGVPTVAKVTGYSVRSVRAYREGTRRAPADFLARVDVLLSSVEAHVEPTTDGAEAVAL